MSADEISNAIRALASQALQSSEIKCRDEHGTWLELKARTPIESEE